MLSFVEEHDYYTAKIGSCQSLFYLFSTFLLFCFFLHHKGPTWAKSSRNAETFPVEEGTALRVISFYLQTGCYRLMLVHHRKRQHANDFPIIPTHPSYFLSYYSQSKRYSNASEYVIMETVMRNEAFSDNRS